MALFNKIKVGSEEYDTWSTYDLVEDIREEIINHVENPDTVTAIASEIASGKQAIAAAINAKGGEASATESFSELAENVINLNDSFITYGVEVTEKIHWLRFICESSTVARLPLTAINDDSIVSLSQPSVFQNCTALESVKMSALTAISGSRVFQGCSALQEVNLPNLTTISGDYVFNNCQSLQEVNMPNLTVISGSYVFQYCSALQEVNMPNLVNLGGVAFNNCQALRNMILGTLSTLEEPFYAKKLNLRNITIGQDTNINLPFQQWTATNVIAEVGGIDELNSNLYNNLLAKLYDHSSDGQTRTLRIGWLANVTQENIDYATSKGWTLTT